MIPEKVIALFKECDRAISSFIEGPSLVEQSDDLNGYEVYTCKHQIKPECRGVCIGYPPIVVGKRNKYRFASAKERNQILDREVKRDHDYE